MTRHIGFALALLCAATLAACTTQPAMAPEHVAALHSGKVVIETLPTHIGFLPASPGAQMLAGVAGATVAGLVGGPAVEGAVAGAAGANAAAGKEAMRKQTPKILRPYLGAVNTRSFDEDIEAIGKKVSTEVAWLNDSVPELMPFVSILKLGGMKQVTQSSGVNAVVFMVPQIAFSRDLKTLYVFTPVHVWVHGSNGAFSSDGGRLVAGARLIDTSPALEKNGSSAEFVGKKGASECPGDGENGTGM